MFAGEPGPIRSIVLANAAAALWTVNPGPLPALVDPRPGHRLEGGGPAGRALVGTDPGGTVKLAAPESRSLEPDPVQDGQSTPNRPVLAIPGATIGPRFSGWPDRSSSNNRCFI